MNLRRLAFMLVLPLATTVAFAQEPPPRPEDDPRARPGQQPLPEAPKEPETTSTKEVAAEVVSANAAAKSINVKVMVRKDASAEPEMKEVTMRVDDEAVADLGTVAQGDKVKLLCRMNGNTVIAVKDINKGESPKKPEPEQE